MMASRRWRGAPGPAAGWCRRCGGGASARAVTNRGQRHRRGLAVPTCGVTWQGGRPGQLPQDRLLALSVGVASWRSLRCGGPRCRLWLAGCTLLMIGSPASSFSTEAANIDADAADASALASWDWRWGWRHTGLRRGGWLICSRAFQCRVGLSAGTCPGRGPHETSNGSTGSAGRCAHSTAKLRPTGVIQRHAGATRYATTHEYPKARWTRGALRDALYAPGGPAPPTARLRCHRARSTSCRRGGGAAGSLRGPTAALSRRAIRIRWRCAAGGSSATTYAFTDAAVRGAVRKGVATPGRGGCLGCIHSRSSRLKIPRPHASPPAA